MLFLKEERNAESRVRALEQALSDSTPSRHRSALKAELNALYA